ncbi:MAG: catechol 2,3-dioxygenase-like lactoylglutathione lyase family enzyme [Parvicella sp.]
MKSKLIYGIQQIGLGVDNVDQAFEWYATRLGFDVPVFDDDSEATHMSAYMGGIPHEKRAVFALNMHGGSGIEIWQYLDKKPLKSAAEILVGDLGINSVFIKSKQIDTTFNRLSDLGENIITPIQIEPGGKKSFYLKDPYDNLLKVKECDSWFDTKDIDTGGIFGCSIGVSNIEAAQQLYSDILGYDHVISDKTDHFDDLQLLPNGDSKFRRVLLSHSQERKGGFSDLLGFSEIELVQNITQVPNKIFKDRFWGDLGFIHLAFDVYNIKALMQECEDKGNPFTIKSPDSFEMGDTHAQWGYLEDMDGTLIEFVETHSIPIYKPLGLKINLKKRNPVKPLPGWMIKSLNLKRIKKFKPKK